MVRSKQSDDNKYLASDYYNNHDFQRALPLFQEQFKCNPNDHYTLLYIGLTNIETGLQAKNDADAEKSFHQAIKCFRNLLDTHDELFEDQALWYLGLSYLYVEDKKNAVKYLNKLSLNDCIFSSKAKELTDKLKE